jgi:penicillin V acylase-like amidase (Ntn superfamily)
MLDLKDYAGFGGELQIPTKWKSIKEKNAIGSKMIKSYLDNNHNNIIHYSFDILNAVGDPVHTKWSTVFDIKNMKIHFKSFHNKEVRTIRFVDFNFDCKSQSKVLDIQYSLSQNITQQFKDYTTQINLKYSLKTFDDLKKRGFFPVDITRESVVTQAKYPETFKCKDNK